MTISNDYYTKLCLLPQWGAWVKSGNSIRFLGYISWLGKIIDQRNGYGLSSLNEDECEQTHMAFIHFKAYAPFEAACLYDYYVKNMSIQDSARRHGIVYNPFSKYLKQSEKKMASLIAIMKRSGTTEIPFNIEPEVNWNCN